MRAPPGASPGLADAVVTWPFLCVCMCSNLLFLEGHRSNWTTAHASDLAYLIVSRYRPDSRTGGLELQHVTFGGHDAVSHRGVSDVVRESMEGSTQDPLQVSHAGRNGKQGFCCLQSVTRASGRKLRASQGSREQRGCHHSSRTRPFLG